MKISNNKMQKAMRLESTMCGCDGYGGRLEACGYVEVNVFRQHQLISHTALHR